MRLRPRLLAFVSLLPLAAWPGLARADDVSALTPEQSASLDKAMTLLTSGLATAKDYTVAPEGDHYKLTLALPHDFGSSGLKVQATDYTADVRPMDGGRWSFENVHGLTPATLTTPPGKDGKPLSLAADQQNQSGHIVIDPTLVAPSTFEGAADGVTITAVAPDLNVDVHSGKATTHLTWTPAGPGKVDTASTVSIEDFVESITGKDKETVKLSVHAVHGGGHSTGYQPDKMTDLMTSVIALVKMIPSMSDAATKAVDQATGQAGSDQQAQGTDTQQGQSGDSQQQPQAPAPTPAKPPLTAEQKSAIHAVIDAMRSLYDGVDASYDMDGFTVDAQGHSVSLKHVGFSEGVASADGRADVKLRIAMEGLDAADIPPMARDYVPHKIVLAPHVTGVPTSVLFDFINNAIDNPDAKPDPTSMVPALFAKGPISFSLDEVAFDVGPATLSATGSVQATAPDPSGVTGTADIEATGLDALMQRMSTDPMLKQGAPALIFLKGIGKDEGGGKFIWKVAYAQNKVLVNGQDLSQLLPH